MALRARTPLLNDGGGGATVAELSGSSSVTFAVAGALVGSAALSGASSAPFTTAASLVGNGALSGASSLTFTTAGELNLAALMSGTSSLAFTTAGSLVGYAALSGSAHAPFTTAGALADETTAELSGASSLTFATAGTLVGYAALSGVSAAPFSTAAELDATGTVELSGSTSLTFTVTGSLVDDSGAGYTPPLFPYGDAPPRRSVPWRDKVSPELDRRLQKALERIERVITQPPRKRRRSKFTRSEPYGPAIAPIPKGAPQEWLEEAYQRLLEAQQQPAAVAESRQIDQVAEARRQKLVAELAAYYQAALREAQLEAERQYQLMLDEEAAILVVMMAA